MLHLCHYLRLFLCLLTLWVESLRHRRLMLVASKRIYCDFRSFLAKTVFLLSLRSIFFRSLSHAFYNWRCLYFMDGQSTNGHDLRQVIRAWKFFINSELFLSPWVIMLTHGLFFRLNIVLKVNTHSMGCLALVEVKFESDRLDFLRRSWPIVLIVSQFALRVVKVGKVLSAVCHWLTSCLGGIVVRWEWSLHFDMSYWSTGRLATAFTRV